MPGNRWTTIDLDRVPLGHYVAFAADQTPIAHHPGRSRTKDLAVALGCPYPLIVPMAKLRRPSEPECSCRSCERHV